MIVDAVITINTTLDVDFKTPRIIFDAGSSNKVDKFTDVLNDEEKCKTYKVQYTVSILNLT